MTLYEARRIVLAKWPQAYGWREFTVSDYAVMAFPGGHVLASAWYAKDAWAIAAAVASLDRTGAK